MLNHSTNPLLENISILDTIKDYINDTFFVFCNPISGDQNGKKILEIADRFSMLTEYKFLDFSNIPNQKLYPIKSFFFNLINTSDRDKGIELIKYYQKFENENNYYNILIGGGDGTTMQMITILKERDINIKNCIFGHLPLGTGNDISITLGFGKKVKIENMSILELYNILLNYYLSDYGYLDIWKSEVVVDNNNNGVVVQNTSNGKIPLLDKKGNILKIFIKSFTNYLSLGYDARVGYDFDPRRTKSRCINQCIYCWEGFKKLFFRKTLPINCFLDSITIYEDEILNSNNNGYHSDSTMCSYNINEESFLPRFNNMKIKCRYKPLNSIKPTDDVKKLLIMKNDPCSIVFQNIISYMAGAKNIWKISRKNEEIGIDHPIFIKDNIKKQRTIDKNVNKPQEINDNKIEIFTFDNGLVTGFEKVIGGFAKKLYHGNGPILIKFNDIVYNENDKTGRLYLNIDGEYFNLRRAKYMIIELDKSFCGGQLSFFMRRNK